MKKKFFSARKIIPPNRFITERHPSLHLWDLESSFPGWPCFPLRLIIPNTSAQCSHYLRFSKGSPTLSQPKDTPCPPEMRAFQLGKKKPRGFSGKVLLLLSPGASLLSFLLILNNLVSIPHRTQISQKKHLEQPPAEWKRLGLGTLEMHVWCSSNEIISKRRGVF